MFVGDTGSPLSFDRGYMGINGGTASSNRADECNYILGGIQALSMQSSLKKGEPRRESNSGEPRKKRVRSVLKGAHGEPQQFNWNCRTLSWWFQRGYKIEPPEFIFTQPNLLLHACTKLPTDTINIVCGFLHRKHYSSCMDSFYFRNLTDTCEQVVKWRRTSISGSHGEWTESDDVENSVKKRANNKLKHSVNPGRGKFASKIAPNSAKSGIDAGLRQLEGCVGGVNDSVPPVIVTKRASPVPVSRLRSGKGPVGERPTEAPTRIVEIPTAPPAATKEGCNDANEAVVVDSSELKEVELPNDSKLLKAPLPPPPIIAGARLGKFQLGCLSLFVANHGAFARGLHNVGYRPLQGPLNKAGQPVEHVHVPPEAPLLVEAIIPSTRPLKMETFYDKCWRWSLRVRSLVGFPLYVIGFRSDWLLRLMGYTRNVSSGIALDPCQKHYPLGESDDMTRLIGYTSAYVAQVDPVIEQHLVSSFSKSTTVDVYCMARMRAVAIDLYHDHHPMSSLADDVLANTVARAAARLKVIIAHSVSHQGGTADRVMVKQW